MKLQFSLSSKQICKDFVYFLVQVIISFGILILFIVLSAKFGIYMIQGNILIYVLSSWIFLSFLVFGYFSKKYFINVIICKKDRLKTKNIFGKINKIDLNKYYFLPHYEINEDTNQLNQRRLDIRQKFDEQIIGSLFDTIPDAIFIQILDYYKLDTDGMEKRQRKTLPLNKWQRDNRYVMIGIMAFPLVCLMVGGIGALLNESYLAGAIYLLISIVGLFYVLYSIIQIQKRKLE